MNYVNGPVNMLGINGCIFFMNKTQRTKLAFWQELYFKRNMSRLLEDRQMDTECSEAESSSSHEVS